MKAYAYMRCSGVAQISGDSFPRQRAAIAEFAASHGLEIAGWYEEQGVSGKNDFGDRPAMRQLFADLGEVKTVVVERLDRLARDLIIQEGIIAKFRELGIELLSTAEDNLCSDDPTRVFIRQVLGAVAQLDRSLIVRKLRAARERKRAQDGRCEGRKPFGERPGEDTVLSAIRAQARQGTPADEIAAMLNEWRSPSRTGKPWRGSVIRKILRRSSRLAANVTEMVRPC